jgi:hypothetical protein
MWRNIVGDLEPAVIPLALFPSKNCYTPLYSLPG